MKYKVHLGKKIYEVEVEAGQAMLLDEYEAKAPKMPAAVQNPASAPASATSASPAPAAAPAAQVASGTPVEAPLPGNILAIKVKEGDVVKAGDVVAIIEAMKMENEIAAPCDGTVKQILKSKGTAVATGDVLMVL